MITTGEARRIAEAWLREEAPVPANGVLYIMTRSELSAISSKAGASAK